MVGGLANLYGWERFYISYRDFNTDYAAGESKRHWVTFWRRCGRFAQFVGLVLGISLLAAFVVVNRANVKLAETKTAATTNHGITLTNLPEIDNFL
jgi:hypothetical protein